MKKSILFISFLIIFQLSFSQVDFIQTHEPDDLSANDLFGNSISVSGEYMFVGASFSDDAYLGEDCGAVYVYRNNGGWSQTQKLQPWYQTNDVSFGNSVSVYGNYAIVGAYYDSYNEIYEGSAYIYYLNTSTNEWNAAKILLPTGSTEGDLFGYKVAINSQYAAVCALFDDESGAISGAVYLFGKDTGGTDNWGLVKKILPDNAFNGLNFGASLSFYEDELFIGATGESTNGEYSGACFVYSENEGGANNWGNVDVLFANDASEYDNFASNIYINEYYLMISAENAGSSNPGEGAVYIFEKDINDFWNQTAKITSSVQETGSKFGASVIFAENLLFVGAPEKTESNTNEGQVYVFSYDDESWSEIMSLNNSNSGENYYFGKSVASDGINVFIGAPQNTETSNTGLNGLIYEYLIDLSDIKKIQNNNIFVYPNPTTKNINVSCINNINITETEIINVSGKIVYRSQGNLQKEQQTIDLSTFKSGIYFLKIKTEKDVYLEKFIVE